MIRMIYGATRIGTKIVKPEDGAFEADTNTERRLVKAGVAEYCGVNAVATPVASVIDTRTSETMPEEENGAEGAEMLNLDARQLSELTKAKLTAMAEDMGIDCAKLKTKAQLIAAITNVPLEDAISEDAPPVLDAEAPVV